MKPIVVFFFSSSLDSLLYQKFQDLEEERIDFMKSSLWSFANISSTVCVSDDAVCLPTYRISKGHVLTKHSPAKRYACPSKIVMWRRTLCRSSKRMELDKRFQILQSSSTSAKVISAMPLRKPQTMGTTRSPNSSEPRTRHSEAPLHNHPC